VHLISSNLDHQTPRVAWLNWVCFWSHSTQIPHPLSYRTWLSVRLHLTQLSSFLCLTNLNLVCSWSHPTLSSRQTNLGQPLDPIQFDWLSSIIQSNRVPLFHSTQLGMILHQANSPTLVSADSNGCGPDVKQLGSKPPPLAKLNYVCYWCQPTQIPNPVVSPDQIECGLGVTQLGSPIVSSHQTHRVCSWMSSNPTDQPSRVTQLDWVCSCISFNPASQAPRVAKFGWECSWCQPTQIPNTSSHPNQLRVLLVSPNSDPNPLL